VVANTPKGEARRAALLDAVLAVLETGGPGAVTHRAVAAEAGVPLAAATYYFASVDELLISALIRVTEQQVEYITRLRGASVAAFARAIHEWTHAGRASAIAQYELLFLAMRRDDLRESADLWYRALEEVVEHSADRTSPTAVAALAIDGLILRMLWSGEPSTAHDVEAALRDILTGHGLSRALTVT
jgi:DNA-binding transcriptional regulator YbjK